MGNIEGWKTKRLDEIGTIVSGSTPPTSIRSFWDGEIVWVTPNDLSKLNTPYLYNSAKHITEKGLDACSSHLLPARSIVMSSRAPIGYVAIPDVDYCTNQGCKSIKLKNDFHSEFVYYNILFNIHKIKNLGEGTTFAEISKRALSTIEMPFPPSVTEQSKIAEILSTVDRAIEQTETLIAKQQRIKTGLMQDLLTRGIDEHGNLRTEQTHKFKDSPLGRIPVERRISTLLSFASNTSDAFVNGPFGSDLLSSELQAEGVPVIYIRDINPGKYQRVSTVCVTQIKANQLAACNVHRGDVLVSKVGDPPCDAAPYRDEERAIVTQDVIRIRPSKKVNSNFLCYLINSHVGRKAIKDIIIQGTRARVSLTEFKMLKLPKPDYSEQYRIAEILDSVQQDIQARQYCLDKLRLSKTALMQDLLTGKKRVSDL